MKRIVNGILAAAGVEPVERTIPLGVAVAVGRVLDEAGKPLLIVAEDAFTFFAAWESLTIGSYFLILRGRESEQRKRVA